MKKNLLVLLGLALAVSANAQWVEQSVGFTTASRGIRDISVVDANTAWAIAYDGTGGSAIVHDFSRTTNGGTTWTPGIIGGPGTNALEFSNIHALDANTAWVAMYNASGGGRIYKTTDGGQNWTHQSTATFSAPDGFPNVVHFFNANEGWAMGDPNNGYFEFYTTTNGGNNWVRVPQANIPANLSGEFGIVDVYSAVGNTLWFGTQLGRIYKSSDKGHTWTVSNSGFTGSATVFALNNVVFKDLNNGLVQNDSLIVRTTDGGATWSPVTYSGTLRQSDLDFVPGTAGTYVSTGANSQISDLGSTMSTDNGSTWTITSPGDTMQLTALDMFSPTIGWAGGFNSAAGGGIFKWTGNLAANATDVGVLRIDSPNSGCDRTATEQVCITVANYGTAAQSNIPVSYSFNGGPAVTGTVAGPVAPGMTASFCFTPTVDISAANTYQLSATTSLTGDAAAGNDAYLASVVNAISPVLSITATPGATATSYSFSSSVTGTSYSWNFGDPASGTNNNVSSNASPTHNFSTPGTYTVNLTVVAPGGCVVTSTETVTIVGREELNSRTLRLFPNPSAGTVQLEMTGDDRATRVEIYSVLGQQVKAMKPGNTQSALLQLADLPAGVYTVKVIGNNNSYTRQLVLQK